MYARGALHNPAIFAEHAKLYETGANPYARPLDYASLRTCILRHAALMSDYGSNRLGLLKMRSAVPHYVRNLPGAKQLRCDIIASKNWDGFFSVIHNFFDQLPGCMPETDNSS
jgi:tRNA-dihydrouridine synthase B